MAMRGLDIISASTIGAEVGDLSRFRTRRELMAYVGIVPSEDSTGEKVKRGPIDALARHAEKPSQIGKRNIGRELCRLFFEHSCYPHPLPLQEKWRL
jgi:transposase